MEENQTNPVWMGIVAVKKDYKGLKRLRNRVDKGRFPTCSCDNCKCKRYIPCTCMRKEPK
jgi:hypothetical protein